MDSDLPPFDDNMDISEEIVSTSLSVKRRQNTQEQIPKVKLNNEMELGLQPDIKHEKFKCGELIILGYNGQLPKGDRGRRRSKIELYRRPKANGIMTSRHYNVSRLTDNHLPIPIDNEIHSIKYRTKMTTLWWNIATMKIQICFKLAEALNLQLTL